MKKHLPLILACIFLLSIISPAYAIKPTEDLISEQMLSHANENEEVASLLKKETGPKEHLKNNKDQLGREELKSIKRTDELSYGEVFKVTSYTIEFGKALVNDKDLKVALSKAPYEWEVSIIKKENGNLGKTIDSTKLYKPGNSSKWQVGSVGSYLDPSQLAFSSDTKAIALYLKERGVTQGDFFSHISIFGLHMDLLYIKAEQGEFFIPLLYARDELYGLNNMALYSRDEIVAAIGGHLRFNEQRPDINSSSGGLITRTGNSQESGTNGNRVLDSKLIALASGALLALMLAGVYLYKRAHSAI